LATCTARMARVKGNFDLGLTAAELRTKDMLARDLPSIVACPCSASGRSQGSGTVYCLLKTAVTVTALVIVSAQELVVPVQPPSQ
jgi:hypothetical protein